MKKQLLLLTTLALSLTLITGCSSAPEQNADPVDTDPTPEIPQSAVQEGKQILYDTATSTNTELLDLTQLSSLVVYGEVYNIVVSPNDYVGRPLKTDGIYYAEYSDFTDQFYHYIVVEDATACCSQGLEFSLVGTHTYPDDFPENGSKIELTGTYGYYDENGHVRYCLSADNITVK